MRVGSFWPCSMDITVAFGHHHCVRSRWDGAMSHITRDPLLDSFFGSSIGSCSTHSLSLCPWPRFRSTLQAVFRSELDTTPAESGTSPPCHLASLPHPAQQHPPNLPLNTLPTLQYPPIR